MSPTKVAICIVCILWDYLNLAPLFKCSTTDHRPPIFLKHCTDSNFLNNVATKVSAASM